MPRNAFDAPPPQAASAAKKKLKRSRSRARSTSGGNAKGSEGNKKVQASRDVVMKPRCSSSASTGASGATSHKSSKDRVKRRRLPALGRKRIRSRGRRSSSTGRSKSNGSSRSHCRSRGRGSSRSHSAGTLQLRLRKGEGRGAANARRSPARKAPSSEPKRTPARRVLRCEHSDEVRQFPGRGRAPPESTSRKVLEAQATPAPRQAKGVVRDVGFSVLYWGGAGQNRPWDFDQRSTTPQLCRQCDSITDTWRGRFDNAQVTFRMCGAEGSGFKRYVHEFSMMSGKGTAEFRLPTFYRWLVARGKKVLNERMVIGSLLETYFGFHNPRDCGIHATNDWGGWERALRSVCERFQEEAHAKGGKFCALVLDEHGSELRISDMVRVQGDSRIGRLLIVLGGPDGIAPKQAEDMKHVLGEYIDLPVFHCALPGGKMHSYYALSTLFMLHDQGLLLPFLSHIAGENPQTPLHKRREGLDSVPSPEKHSLVNGGGLAKTSRSKDDARVVMRISDGKDMQQSPPVTDEILARRAARFGGTLTSPEAHRGRMDRGIAHVTSPDALRAKTSQSPKRRTPSAEGRARCSHDKHAGGIVKRTPSPKDRGQCSRQPRTASGSSERFSAEHGRVSGPIENQPPEPSSNGIHAK